MVIFTKKFGTLDPHLPIVWDKVQKKNCFFYTFPYISSVTFELYKHTQSHKQYYCLKRVKQKDQISCFTNHQISLLITANHQIW